MSGKAINDSYHSYSTFIATEIHNNTYVTCMN